VASVRIADCGFPGATPRRAPGRNRALARGRETVEIAGEQVPFTHIMSSVPSDLRYAKSHEWLKLAGDGTATIGITDYAQNSLGDITYVQLPKIGAALKAGETFGVVESVKAASDIYAPVAGTVISVNEALNSAPETVNRDPYVAGWMLKLKFANPADAGKLLDAASYQQLLG
jgi:glycine cleavage system H protein